MRFFWMLLCVLAAATTIAALPRLTPAPSVFGPIVRPTPAPSGFSPIVRPTPAPSNRRFNYALFARTEVHVLEKCCPLVSRFRVRVYPSALEDDGWTPTLTFHAFQYHPKLPSCWQIVNVTSNGSQRWLHLPPGVRPTSESFCLPTENLLPKTRVSVYYMERPDARAAFVSSPTRDASHLDALAPSGWPTYRRPIATPIYPLAYYYWRRIAPMPQRLISDVRLHATDAKSKRQCPKGYVNVLGNLNHNFVGDPVAYFCVQYALVSAMALPNATFVTDMRIEKSAFMGVTYIPEPHPSHFPRPSIPECRAPSQVVASHLDVLNQQTEQVEELNATLMELNGRTNYTVWTGHKQWLTFCMLKEPLVKESGEYRGSSEFVARLFLDFSQIVRRKRLGIVYNIDTPEDTKQSPYGRIDYQVEDAKAALLSKRRREEL